jgi:hypothetical protein
MGQPFSSVVADKHNDEQSMEHIPLVVPQGVAHDYLRSTLQSLRFTYGMARMYTTEELKAFLIAK